MGGGVPIGGDQPACAALTFSKLGETQLGGVAEVGVLYPQRPRVVCVGVVRFSPLYIIGLSQNVPPVPGCTPLCL